MCDSTSINISTHKVTLSGMLYGLLLKNNYSGQSMKFSRYVNSDCYHAPFSTVIDYDIPITNGSCMIKEGTSLQKNALLQSVAAASNFNRAL